MGLWWHKFLALALPGSTSQLPQLSSRTAMAHVFLSSDCVIERSYTPTCCQHSCWWVTAYSQPHVANCQFAHFDAVKYTRFCCETSSPDCSFPEIPEYVFALQVGTPQVIGHPAYNGQSITTTHGISVLLRHVKLQQAGMS